MNILNSLQSDQIISIIAGIIVMGVFAFAIAMPQGSKTHPGQKGHRPTAGGTGTEDIRDDSFIESFSGEIEEAEGKLPVVVKLAVPAILLWWLLYLIINWVQP